MGSPFRQKPRSHIFWPCDLDLQSQPKVKVNYHTKNQCCRSHGLAVRVLTHRHTHTHRRKDSPDSMTSTADAGGKNVQRALIFSSYIASILKSIRPLQKWKLLIWDLAYQKPLLLTVDLWWQSRRLPSKWNRKGFSNVWKERHFGPHLSRFS